MNFGTDLLIIDGEIIWDGDTLATVSGLDNVKQQAYLRMMTDLGESVFFQDYGSRLFEYLAKPFTPENKKMAEAEARSTLMRVGDQNGVGWIDQILECTLSLVEVEGKTVKMLYVKFIPRGETVPQELNYAFKV